MGAESGENLVKIPGNHLPGPRKPLRIGVGVAVVGDDRVEPRVFGGLEEFQSHMACAKEVKQRRRQHRLDEDFQRPPAHQAGIVFGILVQIEGERAGLLIGDYVTRGLPDLGLDAAAANGAGDGAIVAHQHFRALERRNRAAHIHDGGHGSLAALPLQCDDLLVDIHAASIIGSAAFEVKPELFRPFGP